MQVESISDHKRCPSFLYSFYKTIETSKESTESQKSATISRLMPEIRIVSLPAFRVRSELVDQPSTKHRLKDFAFVIIPERIVILQ